MALTRVGKGGLDKGAIKDQTNLSTQAADTDEYLLYDASTDSLKSIAASNVTPNETLITGKDEITIGNVASDDVLLIYDTSAGALKKITKSAFDALQPGFTSVSPSNLLTGDGTGNFTIVITGTDFDTAATFKLVTDGGTDIALDTVTRDSSTQLTGVVAKNTANLTNANEPFDIVITNGNGLSTTSANAVSIDAQPIWSTASGNIGSIYDSGRSGVSITVAAADPDSGGDITYILESGSLPAGLSGTSTSSGYVISGTASAVGSNTTSTFTIRAKDAASNIADRQFNIIVYAPVQQSFTSSGTFSVPSGVTAVNVLVVAGGGGIQYIHDGGTDFGGGGAGGLIYRPGFSVTPGGTVTVTVGNGGANSSTVDSGTTNPRMATHNFPAYPVNYSTPSTAANGQDSVFGTLTAKGGGAGTGNNGNAGGSSGGSGGGSGTPASATQPTQPGDSGTYGFGNPGGTSGGDDGSGGGGAGGAGANYPGPGNGGIGRAYTIADGTTSVYYAGGGGGGGESPVGTGGQGGGGNGGVNCNHGALGTANRGGGAGGGDNSMATGPGGKGIVIVAY